MEVLSIELAAMADFEFTPGRPPKKLATELATLDSIPGAAAEEKLLSEEWAASVEYKDLRYRFPSGAAGPTLAATTWSPATFTVYPTPYSRMNERWEHVACQFREAFSAVWHRDRRPDRNRAHVEWPDFSPRPSPSRARRGIRIQRVMAVVSVRVVRAQARAALPAAASDLLFPPSGHPEVLGITVLLLPEAGAGVATVWIRNRAAWKTPWDAKNSLWGRTDYWADLLRPTGLLERPDYPPSETTCSSRFA